MLEHGADAGFALDGDADRCLAVDHRGEVVDGDQIMAILALGLRDAGRLADDTVVVTVIEQPRFVRAMERHGVTVRQAAVGDRYVLEEMNAGGYSLRWRAGRGTSSSTTTPPPATASSRRCTCWSGWS